MRAAGLTKSSLLASISVSVLLSSVTVTAQRTPPFAEVLIDLTEAVEGIYGDEGARIAHPLLPADAAVRNDVRLGGPHPHLLVVSGSNMSGKSTLLRTVGVNAVLALAGAPVRATRLRLSPLAIGATLRLNDSLQEGRSRFYAEITRIAAIVRLARSSGRGLFLCDELLSGTNSHDRLQGATGILKGLLALDYAAQTLDFYETPARRSGPVQGWSLGDGGEPAARRIPVEPREQLLLELSAFVEAVREESAPPVTPEDGLAALAVADALTRSARTGQSVRPRRWSLLD